MVFARIRAGAIGLSQRFVNNAIAASPELAADTHLCDAGPGSKRHCVLL